MNQLKNIAVALSTFFILYSWGMWFIIFDKYATQAERQHHFLEKWVVFDSLHVLSGVLILFTMLSLWILLSTTSKQLFHPILRYSLSTLHAVFLLFMAWSYL